MTHKVRAVRARPTDQALAVPVEPVFAVSPLRASILRALPWAALAFIPVFGLIILSMAVAS